MSASEAVKTVKESFTEYIGYGIEYELSECIDNGWIAFDSDEDKTVFVSELIMNVLDEVEYFHDGCFFDYLPNFSDLVCDYAHEIGVWIA